MALTRFFQDPFFGLADPFTTSYSSAGDTWPFGRSESGMMPFRSERGQGEQGGGMLSTWRPRCMY